jgi:hypothetical protein
MYAFHGYRQHLEPDGDQQKTRGETLGRKAQPGSYPDPREEDYKPDGDVGDIHDRPQEFQTPHPVKRITWGTLVHDE